MFIYLLIATFKAVFLFFKESAVTRSGLCFWTVELRGRETEKKSLILFLSKFLANQTTRSFK